MTEIAVPSPVGCPPAKRRNKKRVRPQLLMRGELDGRTNAAKIFDRLITEIEADLAGRDQLSAIERTLVEAYAGAYVTLANLNTRLALGEEIDLAQHTQAVNAMVRVASRLGLRRRAKNVDGLTLGELWQLDDAEQQREAAAARAAALQPRKGSGVRQSDEPLPESPDEDDAPGSPGENAP